MSLKAVFSFVFFFFSAVVLLSRSLTHFSHTLVGTTGQEAHEARVGNRAGDDAERVESHVELRRKEREEVKGVKEEVN